MIDYTELKSIGLKLSARSRELQGIDEQLTKASMEAEMAIESYALSKAGWQCSKAGWLDPKRGGFHSRSEAYRLLQLRLNRAKSSTQPANAR